MADVRVSSESMRSLARKIEGLASDYQNIYTSELYGTVAENVKKAWFGADSQALLTRLEGFHNDFDNMYQVLNQYAAHLINAAKAYDAQQEELTRRANQLKQDASNS